MRTVFGIIHLVYTGVVVGIPGTGVVLVGAERRLAEACGGLERVRALGKLCACR